MRTLFSRVMHEALGALPHYGNFVEVRTKTLVLLHRMVETLGEDLAPFLSSSLPELLAGADPKEVQELVALLNQRLICLRPLRLSASTLGRAELHGPGTVF